MIQVPDPRPCFPPDRQRLGVAFLGFGGVVKKWHVPAYRKYGLRIVGAFDTSPEVVASAAGSHPEIRMYRSLDELLEDPEVDVVDVATRPRGRLELVARVLEADKHVLAQKPVATGLAGLRDVLELARRRRLRVAVNQNGRWAPPWRLATRWIEDGVIGDVAAVSHLFDTRLPWVLSPERHGTAHFLLFDYACHWIDITRCWLRLKPPVSVQARDFRAPVAYEPGDLMSQSAWIALHCADGTTAVIRGVTCGAGHRGHPFWVHGTRGTLRGDVDTRSRDHVELEVDGTRTRIEPEGDWFPDGFAGAMGELMCAVAEDREPYHSLADNELTLRLSMAACHSAEREGAPVAAAELGERPEDRVS